VDALVTEGQGDGDGAVKALLVDAEDGVDLADSLLEELLVCNRYV